MARSLPADQREALRTGAPTADLRVGSRRLARRAVAPQSTARDLVELTKPTITAMNVLMAAGALYLAPVTLTPLAVLAALVGTALAVASANALNMYLERDSDRLMKRTRRRPLPDGRMKPTAALIFGLSLGILGIGLLANLVNGLTAGLGALALVMYVAVYTPLKRRSPMALLIGAVPGAMPPLMGWTAATGQLDAPGLVLFSILLIWQLPHFLAIAIYCRKDYARVGIKAVSVVRGDGAAKIQAVAYATLLIPVSLLLVPLDVAGWLYLTVALGLGLWFLSVGLQGLRAGAGTRWARSFFMASLIYLPALTLALTIDAVIGL